MDDPAVEALRALVRIPTVSSTDEDAVDADAFERLIAELAHRFPILHQHLDATRICTHGLLLHWRGRAAERPVVLMAHLDVVPIDPTAPWQHPPFDAVIADGAIWGRGTLDDKGSVVGVCAAVEQLLSEGFTPAQDVWLSFGAREEVSGPDAPAAVAALRERGVEPWFVLDEGGAVAEEAFAGISAPLGVVGVAEKGTTTFILRAEGRGGHSSTPAPHGPTARIARAVVRLERRQLGASIPAPTAAMFARLAPHASPALRPLLAHAARLGPALARALVALGPEPAAMVRTTMAVTQLAGSPGHNVIASSATAAVNLRLQLGDSVASAREHVRRAIRDPDITIETLDANEPGPVSPVDDAFALIERAIAEEFPDAVVTPYVVMAATDSRFFAEICPRVYRFAPFRMSKAQRQSIHSYDERIGVDDLVRGVRWYRRLIEQLPASDR